ncbi:class I SAM-dependent methyltransferase [Modestobacter sp. SSW1-42]|uniref:class I SAM-dependent methyltransferase n=1 Tax=Modestobacter sp. SSW1-42 TaxID=596372 RepID=UPI00398701E2
MQPYRRLWPSPAGVHVEVTEPADRVVDLLLDGRRVWSFREPAEPADAAGLPAGLPDDVDPGQLRFQPWPESLRRLLSGTFSVELRPLGTDAGVTTETSLGGDPGPLRLVDVHDRPLVVNKWGRLGHALADAPAGMIDRMLDSMDRVRELLEEHLGPVVYVTGGTLLGPVREDGHVMPHDDDADLAYLSRRSHPADVALEAFDVGRLLCAAGFEVIRLSVAHVQVLVSHDGVPDHYVDVFSGFHLEGWWYQHFPIRARVGVERLLPPSRLLVEGRDEPAPREPEVMLEELFGTGWRVPDPAFTFDVPAETGDRLYGWFADYNVDREGWEDEVLLAPRATGTVLPEPSDFAAWVDGHAPAGHALLELGCGRGRDAAALAARGRTVRAVDYSRYAVQDARRLADALPGEAAPALEVLNLLDTRAVVRLGAELASAPGPWSVHGRRLLNAIEDRGRDNVFRLCGMLLRGGGAARFDVVADHGYAGVPGHRHLTVSQLVTEAARHRLELTATEQVVEPFTWLDVPVEEPVPLTRLTFTRRSR